MFLSKSVKANVSPQVPSRGSSHPTSVFNQPPKKVIKAERKYFAQKINEISFDVGEFFYVIQDSNPLEYEVINPIAKTRGTVPRSHFSNLDKNRYSNTSEPGTDRKGSISSEGASIPSPKSPERDSRQEQAVLFATVPQVELKSDGQYWFTLQLERINTRHLLFRTYDDFYILLVSLLTHFPKESGRKGRARQIPFLKAPQKNANAALVQKQRLELEVYVNELLKLNKRIKESAAMHKFLQPRQSSCDIETGIEVAFDGSLALLDLFHQYDEEDVLICEFRIEQESVSFEIECDVTHAELIDICKSKAQGDFDSLGYKDESDQMMMLYGDEDLSLLIKTNKDNLVFYVYVE